MRTIQLIEKDNLSILIPLLKILNPSIEENVLSSRLDEMKSHSYNCVGVFIDGKLAAACGFWILVKYYVGKHIEPDNVIVLPEYRGMKIGEEMMQWIYEYGKSIGCVASELNCYVNNPSGVKFWINQGYKIIGYHFQKQLD